MSVKNDVLPKRAIDVLMTLLLPLLMSYELIGEATHEWLGISMMVLLAVHHVLNSAWHKNLFKGRYSAQRLVMTALDILLAVILLAQAISGIMMAKHTFEFLPHVGRRSAARAVHMVGAYWGFVLMSVHAGLHMGALMGKLKRLASGKSVWLFRTIMAALLLYGGHALMKRELLGYMLMQRQFAFLDFEEPLAFFFTDYVAIMLLFALAGYALSAIWGRPQKSQKVEKKFVGRTRNSSIKD